jgi:hypothetical protein
MLGLKSACSLAALTLLFAGAGLGPRAAISREKEPPPAPAIVEVHTGQQDCLVDLDSGTASKTGDVGVLILSSVEPGEHYLHVSCPDGRKTSRFIVPSPGETFKVSSADDLSTPGPGMGAAELRARLHEHIQEAIRLRARGRMDEAAEQLRDARRLDPDNSDLHRELGITFLLGKDWKRARIEMLEAIHSDPADAEAYNGLGYALTKMGMIDAAVEAFHIATRLDPSDTSYRRQYFDAIARQTEQRAEQKKR